MSPNHLTMDFFRLGTGAAFAPGRPGADAVSLNRNSLRRWRRYARCSSGGSLQNAGRCFGQVPRDQSSDRATKFDHRSCEHFRCATRKYARALKKWPRYDFLRWYRLPACKPGACAFCHGDERLSLRCGPVCVERESIVRNTRDCAPPRTGARQPRRICRIARLGHINQVLQQDTKCDIVRPKALVYIRRIEFYLWPNFQRRQRIARAAPAFGVLNENAALDERENITIGRILRAFCQLRVFCAGELTFEPIHQAVVLVPSTHAHCLRWRTGAGDVVWSNGSARRLATAMSLHRTRRFCGPRTGIATSLFSVLQRVV